MTDTTRTFRIFVSSTFEDLKAERDHLHRHVFSRLRSLCRQHGARFQAVDLRWGVSEEAGLQQTMRICLGEIARCQQTTPRPNFIVLLADRYGWRPLPETIPADQFDELVNQLGDQGCEELREWYRRDDNAIPLVYVLQARTGVYQEEENWIAVERRLHAHFDVALGSLPPTVADRDKFELSAVEQEIVEGVLNVSDAPDHVFCFFRHIVDMPRDSSATGFVDLVTLDPSDPSTWTADGGSEARIQALKETLRRALPGNCFDYEAKWIGNGDVARITTTHLHQLGEDVYSALAGIIETELAEVETIDELDQEIDAHLRFGKTRAQTFVGRADIIARINGRLTSELQQPLVVHGAPGSGKSALLAHIAEEASASKNRVLVVRFIGATPDSSDVRSMLLSLCRQISRAYGADQGGLPTDFRGLAQKLPECLALATAERPLIVILDALDQLSDTDNGRGLAWLPTGFPPHVSVVVSILGRECPDVLTNILPDSILVAMPAMTAAEGDALLREWLSRAGRTLQDPQREEVRSKFATEGLPLYLRLAFEEARRWPSFLPAARTVLSPDIPGLISAMFDRLASRANHGTVLVARSLGCLAAARNGLTEDELLDLLSPPYDSAVLSDLRQRSPKSPTVDRLPVVLWSRLYFDLAPYLSERSADGTSLMTFYHRQFQEAAQQVYLSAAHDSRDCHRRLAAYFASQQLDYRQDDRLIPNLRALAELPYQQTHGELWPELFATLTDFHFLQSKAATGQQVQPDANGVGTTNYTGIYDLQADFELALQRWRAGAKP